MSHNAKICGFVMTSLDVFFGRTYKRNKLWLSKIYKAKAYGGMWVGHQSKGCKFKCLWRNLWNIYFEICGIYVHECVTVTGKKSFLTGIIKSN